MPKILVVEDSKEMLSNISMLLKMNGYEVFEAEDGVSGFEAAKKQLPDVIVSDIMMPVADGLRLLQEVRKEPDLITTPFIFLTAKVDRRDVRTGMISGADDYVSKPFKSKELIEAIETQLKKKYTKDKKFQEIYKTISSYIPHELRTPLVAIFGYTNFLLEDYEHLEKNDVVEMLKNIKTASSRLYRTIEKYLRFNDAELVVANKKEYLNQLNEILESPKHHVSVISSRFAEQYARVNDLLITVEDVPLKILDEHFITIVEELVENAFKFSVLGSNVIVNGFLENSFYVLEIKDFGCGMTQEEISGIAPFIQIGRKNYEHNGNGLGLATVKLLTGLYNLPMEIESIKNSHTTIRVLFTPAQIH
jgi:two-component system, sensor histidine kinase and response regulator